MYTSKKTLFVAASLIPSGALALSSVFSASRLSQLNNWHEPCTKGKCAYTSGDGVHGAFSSFIITGSSSALSDLTEAAGWKIDGCSNDWAEGAITVQITCDGTEEQVAQCDGLFEGDAVDTIVRLPENCGLGPFGRIAAITTSSTKFRRAGQTHEVTLDYAFDQITHDRGEVEFAVATSNSEELGNSLLSTHSLLSSFVKRSENETNLLARWEKTHQFDIPPINIDKSFNLFSTSIDCPAPTEGGAGFSASVSVDAAVKVDAQVGFGFTVGGKIFPPKINKMQVIGTLNGQAGADFTIKAGAKGVFDTGDLTIWTAGLPGANIPGILSVGPSFNILGSLSADVGVEAVVNTGVKWEFPSLKMAFPQDSGEQIAEANQVNTPFTLSVDPTVTANGNVHAEVTPRIDLGVKLLAGLAEATVYLDLVADATLGMNLEAQAPVSGDLSSLDASASASGCAKLDAGVHVKAGAKGKIAGVFDKDVDYTIFEKSINVFDKCFGANPTKRALVSPIQRSAIARRDFVCPNLSLEALTELLSF
ncbi:hypothetical protein BKA62DRAFT_635547 [Auriculariales sp. MPI-PUGE-AT-0066]|nr:hypothetical protein BKA62DRAFT_635547 [Auriculariales sp. MPI-PUGE-AT-0066]